MIWLHYRHRPSQFHKRYLTTFEPFLNMIQLVLLDPLFGLLGFYYCSLEVLADISTANTRETNAIAAVNAKNATDLSASTYAQLSQTYRDQLEQTWKTTDNANERATKISVQTLQSNATEKAAQFNADAAFSAAIGQLSISLMAGGGSKVVMDGILDAFKGLKKILTGE